MADSLSTSGRDTTTASPPPPSAGEAGSSVAPDLDLDGGPDGKRAERGPAADGGTFGGRSRWLLFNIVVPLGLLAFGGLVIWLLGSVEPTQRPSADDSRIGRLRALPPVRVTPIRTLAETGQPLQLQVDGTVVPYREVQIAAEVAGRIIYKSPQCEAGNYVEQGAVLVRIDPTDYELEVEQFTRQQEQAYEALREVDQEMVNTKRLIEVAKEDVELQRREVKRLEALPEGFASQGELDRARRSLLQANQQQVTYENQLSVLEKRRSSLEASERLATSRLRAARVNLERTEIRAPIEGVIVREDAELNSFVARGNPIVTLEDTSKVEVASNLRMDQLYWVLNQAGEPVSELETQASYDLPETPAIIEYELSGRDGATYRWRGRLLGYDGIGLDPRTRTVPVRVLVDDPQRYLDERGQSQQVAGPTTLVRGMYVRVLLELQPRSELFVVPARALKPGNRVWAFAPDESVLDRSVGGDIAEAETSEPEPLSPNGSDGAAIGNELESFDPSQWVPGQVQIAAPVLPIDSLTLGRGNSADAPAVTDSEDGEAGRQWICEDRSGSLAGGTPVVVSPLGSVGQGGMPARAQRDGFASQPDEAVTAAGVSVRLSDREATP